MNITDYIIRYHEHTSGEDELYRDVEWTSNCHCPVKNLIPGRYVPFIPDKHLSEPSINCLSVNDTEVVLEYNGYTGDGRLGLQKQTVTLTTQHKSWGCFFGGGKYSTSRSIDLLKPEEVNNED